MTRHHSVQRMFSGLLAAIVVAPGGGKAASQPGDHFTETGRGLAGNIRVISIGVDSAFNAESPITCMLQDKQGNYWFGTNSAGAYRYDGKTLKRFTLKDGLISTQVKKLQEDEAGHIWFGTGGGVCRFDGRTFTTFPGIARADSGRVPAPAWTVAPGDLWFEASGGACRYDGQSLTYLPLPGNRHVTNSSRTPDGPLGPFTVYCTYKDRAGNLWFGTQSQGVCRFDGKSFTWFTEKGLAGPAVLAIFQDTAGDLWFGNNGAGVFRYDGQSLVNFTAAHGLSNPAFLSASRVSTLSGLGTLARIYTIGEDAAGNIWFGTIDAGVWRYDGTSLTNLTARDGLDSEAIQAIYRDRTGSLLFGTDAGSVYRFKDMSFVRFTVKGGGDR